MINELVILSDNDFDSMQIIIQLKKIGFHNIIGFTDLKNINETEIINK